MQIDLLEGPPLLCNRTRPDWGIHNNRRFPLPCVLDLGHAGDVHRDRLHQEWTSAGMYVPIVRHIETVRGLVALELHALAALDRIAQESVSLGMPMQVRALAQTERQDARRTLVGLGLMLQGGVL